MHKVNEIFETTEYDIFKFLKTNRDVKEREDLLKETKRGFIAPIVVDKNMTIIDRQNRLYHSKKAKVPIKFFIDPNATTDDIVSMNTTAVSWEIIDYIKSYAKSGNEHYQKLLGLINQKYTGLTITVTTACDNYHHGKNIRKIIESEKF